MSQSARNDPESARLESRRDLMSNDHEDEDYGQGPPPERCCRCDGFTNVEAGYNSFFRDDSTGPYCEICFNLEPVVEAIQDANQEAWK
jgi:hypothetical protein